MGCLKGTPGFSDSTNDAGQYDPSDETQRRRSRTVVVT